jgi:hypothetical protein
MAASGWFDGNQSEHHMRHASIRQVIDISTERRSWVPVTSLINAEVNGLSGKLLPDVDKDYLARLYCSPQHESFHFVAHDLDGFSKRTKETRRAKCVCTRQERTGFGPNRNATPLRSVPG